METLLWGVPLYIWIVFFLTNVVYLALLGLWPALFDRYIWPPEGVREIYGEEFAEHHTRDELKPRLNTPQLLRDEHPF